jgi:trehalose utilization protein
VNEKTRVTVWNEYIHELENHAIAAIYPRGIHGAIAEFLGQEGDLEITTATLRQEEHGLTEDVLAQTDVLIWWGHRAHDDVQDAVVDRVYRRVLAGMGLIILHSAHFSKIFKKLMGTSCGLRWREVGEKERVWVIEQGHPIAHGLGHYFEIPQTEMYGERFDVPAPDTLVLISWYQGGEVFRSGCCYNRGRGKIFYFAPGHETYPIYYQKEVQQVIKNAVRWAQPTFSLGEALSGGAVPPLEPLG